MRQRKWQKVIACICLFFFSVMITVKRLANGSVGRGPPVYDETSSLFWPGWFSIILPPCWAHQNQAFEKKCMHLKNTS